MFFDLKITFYSLGILFTTLIRVPDFYTKKPVSKIQPFHSYLFDFPENPARSDGQ